MALAELETPADLSGTIPRNHKRDASAITEMFVSAPLVAGDLSASQKRVVRTLASLDSRRAPEYDRRVRLPLCVCRRRLRASDDKMQELFYLGLVSGAGSRDARGSGNTPDSSWWWLSSFGLMVAREIGADIAGGCWESAARDWRGISAPLQ